MRMTARVFLPKRLLTMAGERKLMIELHEEAINRIKTLILPDKFTSKLFQRYPEVAHQRAKRYINWKRKLRRLGRIRSELPNRFSGELMWQTLVGSRVTSTSTRGRLYIKTGLGTYMSGKRMGQRYWRGLPDWQWREIEYLSQEDLEQISKWVGFWYVDQAIGPKYERYLLKTEVNNFPPIEN